MGTRSAIPTTRCAATALQRLVSPLPDAYRGLLWAPSTARLTDELRLCHHDVGAIGLAAFGILNGWLSVTGGGSGIAASHR